MKRKYVGVVRLLFLLVLFAFLQGCLDTKARPDNWLAKVDGNFITKDVFEKRYSQLPEAAQKQIQTAEQKKALLDQLVSEELLYQAAKDGNVADTQAYKDALTAAQERLDLLKRQTMISEFVKQSVNSDVGVKPEEVKTYFDANPTQFAEFERRRASHILVKTRDEALSVKSKLRRGAAFESLAETTSLDPTSKNGGDLGWFARGQLDKGFEDAAFSLVKKGDVSSIVQTKFGFHIIKLSDKQIVPKRSFDQVKPQIEQFLVVGKQREGLTSYVETLKDTYEVETNDASFQ